MKKLVFILCGLCLSLAGSAQSFQLKECVVIGQFEKYEDRYAMEVTFCEIFKALRVKSLPATNFIKQGAQMDVLLSDSLKSLLSQQGISTYCLINVKGYDKRFKKSEAPLPFSEALERASIYNLYKEDISSVTLEFIFYQNNVGVFSDVFKVSNIGDRDDVIKRIKKKAPMHILKNWRL
ncbi:MAG: hypothetical protein EB023_06305 [Flavobacteriia bacterium]|nr:hypothetical protein [Flavobacteriia bacterium]